MDCIIGQILHAYLLNKNEEHWPEYVAITEIAVNSTIDASIDKAPFEVFYGKNIPLPVDLLLFRESSINPHAHKFTSKMKQLVYMVRSTMHDP